MQLRPSALRILWQRHVILNRPRDLPVENLFAEVGFCAEGTADAYAVAGFVFDRLDHAGCGAETPGHVEFGLGEEGTEEVGEFDEVGFSFDRGFFFVFEGAALEGPAGEVEEVYFCLFEGDAEVAAVFGGLAAGLEFYGVDFDADDEGGVGDAGADF